ncbi:MAG: bifunctional AP-4-A phosphorylase/ADP sulfurylase [Thelocarpon superellum]|nr:MAG: bifunctional AP-4-A phosphorylase/ADP sulfurylase [Thelocarpon superellum]
MESCLGLPGQLDSLVKDKYINAKARGELSFTPTELAVIRLGNVAFQLRYCPNLAKKPEKPEKPAASPPSGSKKPNPFLHPPGDLLIANVPGSRPSHRLVLNKYPIIPNHFLLVTTSFKEQNQLLEADDLALTLSCLRAWRHGSGGDRREERLFAFFNGGEHSGASQSHRHVQFLPVEGMKGPEGSQGWSLLCDTLTYDSGYTPFLYYRAALAPDIEPEALHGTYLSLCKRAGLLGDESTQNKSYDPRRHNLPKSYNLALTTSTMVLCPRRQGGAFLDVREFGEGQETRMVGPINLNGTMLAGSLMVKRQEEWDLLQQDGGRLLEILRAVGYHEDVAMEAKKSDEKL